MEDAPALLYNVQYFTEWTQKLKQTIRSELPVLDPHTHPGLFAALESCQLAHDAKKVCERECQQAKKQKPPNPPAMQAAQTRLQEATARLASALDDCLQAASTVLDSPGLQRIIGNDYDDCDLVTYTVLRQATPKGLAEWCRGGNDAAAALDALLHNVDLLQTFLEGGGVASGQYGHAMELYSQLYPSGNDGSDGDSDQVLQRLALAVALEFAAAATPGVTHKMNPNYQVDPVERYAHYKQAYLAGELDPHFSQFTVWELRHVVNAEATNEELAWGRESLRNYRPDFCISDDVRWRYCRIVKSDVAYCKPDWYKEPRSYDQILAGGGKCGPRAWYGRFACQMFGIPTWGVRQPGHAAMARWTSKRWTTCLGAGFPFSFWQGRGGLDFELETMARNAVANDEQYVRKVERLGWIAGLMGENNKTVLDSCLPSPRAVWYALELFQRKRLVAAACDEAQEYQPQHARSKRPNRIQTLMDEPLSSLAATESIFVAQDGTVLVPAATCTNHCKKVLVTKSFLGGRQVFLGQDGSLEYDLADSVLSKSLSYHLRLRFNTVHRHEKPLLLTVVSSATDSAKQEYEIAMPYTMGKWEMSQAIRIHFTQGGGSTKLHLKRQGPQFGVAIKDLQLEAIHY